MPKVSICIPLYNGETYLAECLTGVLTQTFEDCEILIVDDGSSDASLDVVQEYARADGRIRVHQNASNLGLVANWNNCVKLAKGEWIKFVFQDDLIDARCVEKMLVSARRPLVFCRRRFLFHPDTPAETVALYGRIPSLDDVCEPVGGDIEAAAIARAALTDVRNFFGEPTAALMHRSVFPQFGMFNSDLRQICDLEYWTRVGVNTGVTFVDETLATFRYHSASTTARNRDPAFDERIALFDELVLLHEFAYSKQYLPLRVEAKRLVPPREMRREFARKAAWMRQRAVSEAKQPGRLQSAWLRDWQRLARRYRRFDTSLHQRAHRVKEMWNRHVGWRWSPR